MVGSREWEVNKGPALFTNSRGSFPLTVRYHYPFKRAGIPLRPADEYAMNRGIVTILFPATTRATEGLPPINWSAVAAFCCLWICLYALRSSWTVEDTILASTLIPNLAQGHGVDLGSIAFKIDLARPEGLCFIRDASGRVLPLHPIGMLLLSAPLQGVLWLVAWISGAPIDVTNSSFLPTRLAIEKLSASFFAALTAVYLYRTLILFMSSRLALILAGLYAFGSSSLTTLSQGLWPHTGINLILMYLTYLLLNNDSSLSKRQECFVFLALGLLCAIRPTSIPFAIIFSFVFLRFFGPPKYTALLVCGFVLISTTWWNVSLFHHILGGYTHIANKRVDMHPIECLTRLALILASPQRGYVIFNPFLIYAAFALKPIRALGNNKRIVMLVLVACILCHYLICATNPEWHGGYTFGPRYMLDVLAPSFLLAAIGFNAIYSRRPGLAKMSLALIALTSIALHVFGVLGDRLPHEGLRMRYRQLLIPS